MTAALSRRRYALALSLAGIGLILSGWALLQFLRTIDPWTPFAPADLSAIPVAVEFAAPDLELHDLLGHRSALADSRGQVVLVNLWATWCPPCKAEMPVLQEFYEAHRDGGFALIAINDGEAPGTVERFVADQGLTFAVWLDPEYRATEVAFRAPNLPTSYVIDRSGLVRLMWIGAIDKPTLVEYVTPLVEE